MWVLPSDCEMTPMWKTVSYQACLSLQYQRKPENAPLSTLLTTISTLFSQNQAPFRIVCSKGFDCGLIVGDRCWLVGEWEEEADARRAWTEIVEILTDSDGVGDNDAVRVKSVGGVLEWVRTKVLQSLQSSSSEQYSTHPSQQHKDQLSTNAQFRNTARSLQRTFPDQLPPNTRLVGYWPCLYDGVLGWLYLTREHLCFHSQWMSKRKSICDALKQVESVRKSAGIFGVGSVDIKLISNRSSDTNEEEGGLCRVYGGLMDVDAVYALIAEVVAKCTHKSLTALLKSNSNENGGGWDRREASRNDSASHTTVLQSLKIERELLLCRRIYRVPAKVIVEDGGESRVVVARHWAIITFAHRQASKAKSNGDALKRQQHQVRQWRGELAIAKDHLLFCSQQNLLCMNLDLRMIEMGDGDDVGDGPLIFTTRSHVVSIWSMHKTSILRHLQQQHRDGNEKRPDYRDIGVFVSDLPECAGDGVGRAGGGDRDKFLINRGLGHFYGYNTPETLDDACGDDATSIAWWIKYWQVYGRNTCMIIDKSVLCSLFLKIGVPFGIRGEVWECVSGSLLGRCMGANKLDRGNDHLAPAAIREEVEKDLHRSYPSHPAYRVARAESPKRIDGDVIPDGIETLRSTLLHFARDNPQIGYCQALNIITASLLLYCTPSQTLSLLSTLVDDTWLAGYYTPSMWGVILDSRIFDAFLRDCEPCLWSVLHDSGVECSIVYIPLFLTLYRGQLSEECWRLFMDCFLLFGVRILHGFGVAIASSLAGRIVAANCVDVGTLTVLFGEHLASLGVDKMRSLLITSINYGDHTRGDAKGKQRTPTITNQRIYTLRAEGYASVIAAIRHCKRRMMLREPQDVDGNVCKEAVLDAFLDTLYSHPSGEEEADGRVRGKGALLALFSKCVRWRIHNHGTAPADIDDNERIYSFIARLIRHQRFCSAADGKGETGTTPFPSAPSLSYPETFHILHTLSSASGPEASATLTSLLHPHNSTEQAATLLLLGDDTDEFLMAAMHLVKGDSVDVCALVAKSLTCTTNKQGEEAVAGFGHSGSSDDVGLIAAAAQTVSNLQRHQHNRYYDL